MIKYVNHPSYIRISELNGGGGYFGGKFGNGCNRMLHLSHASNFQSAVIFLKLRPSAAFFTIFQFSRNVWIRRAAVLLHRPASCRGGCSVQPRTERPFPSTLIPTISERMVCHWDAHLPRADSSQLRPKTVLC